MSIIGFWCLLTVFHTCNSHDFAVLLLVCIIMLPIMVCFLLVICLYWILAPSLHGLSYATIPFTNDFHDCCLFCSLFCWSESIALSRVVLVKETKTKHSGSPTQKRRNCSGLIWSSCWKFLNLMNSRPIFCVYHVHCVVIPDGADIKSLNHFFLLTLNPGMRSRLWMTYYKQ